MSTQEHEKNVTALSNFLLLPVEPGLTEPPPIPLSLDGLPAAVYLDAALHYVEQYPFDREFYKYRPKTREPYPCMADSQWKEKARTYLQACIKVDRSAIAPLRTSGSYDAAHEQQEFVRKIVFPRRWKLEELASEMLALVEFVRSETRTASAVLTPMDTGLPKNTTVVDQVRLRDENCRLTGVGRVKSCTTAEELKQRRQARQATVEKLQVVHGLPFQMGKTSFALVEALTGIKCEGWEADSIGNAFLAQPPVHGLFGSFRIYLEWNADGQIIIRGRTGAGDPELFLEMIVNDRYRMCAQPGEFLDTPVRPRFDTTIADIDPKYFILHKFVGDIVWMCGGAEPVSDDEEDDEEDMVVSDINIDMLLEKLRSPAMDLVPREQEMMFGRMVLVQKDTVWV
ncbi:HNHc domain-containing protein [Mycena venus]|uniref:HNHc domain-containing protein n=1 Tax=Mycena venus TaxID=2733690 RepID=A0A8H6X770_9AGAR|nr:HNHc domain-containing protein [Mycena venus]